MKKLLIIMMAFFSLSACSSKHNIYWREYFLENPITIAIVGEEPEIDSPGLTFIPLNLSNQDYDLVWVRESKVETYYSEKKISEIKKIIDRNKPVFFLSEKDPYEKIAPLLGIKNGKVQKVDQEVQTGFYFIKTKGVVYLGTINSKYNTWVHFNWESILQTTVDILRGYFLY